MPVESQHEKQWLYCYPNTDSKREKNRSQQARGEPASRCLRIRWNTLSSVKYYFSVLGYRDWVLGGFAREQFNSLDVYLSFFKPETRKKRKDREYTCGILA